MKIALLVRPGVDAAVLDELRRVVSGWRTGHAVRPRVAFEPGDGRRFARAAAGRGADVVVAAGGDGTVNEVVNGLLDASGETRLGIIPLGTANDFAAGLELPETLEDAAEVVVSGRARVVDAARVNERAFINVSTGGVVVVASEETPEGAKQLFGPWAYLIAGVRKLDELSPAALHIETPDGVVHDGDAHMFAVGNGRRTGGGNLVTPRAALDDGELDLVVVPAMAPMTFVGLLPDLRAGRHVDRDDVVYVRASAYTVESEGDLLVHADGERVPGERFRYEVVAGGIRVMTP